MKKLITMIFCLLTVTVLIGCTNKKHSNSKNSISSIANNVTCPTLDTIAPTCKTNTDPPECLCSLDGYYIGPFGDFSGHVLPSCPSNVTQEYAFSDATWNFYGKDEIRCSYIQVNPPAGQDPIYLLAFPDGKLTTGPYESGAGGNWQQPSSTSTSESCSQFPSTQQVTDCPFPQPQ